MEGEEVGGGSVKKRKGLLCQLNSTAAGSTLCFLATLRITSSLNSGPPVEPSGL